MPQKPVARPRRHLTQGTGLGKQVSGPWHDPQFVETPQPCRRPGVELEHVKIKAANQQEGRATDIPQRTRHQIGPATTADHGPDKRLALSRDLKGNGRTRTGAEQAER